MKHYKPSNFNMFFRRGDNYVIFNTLSGGICELSNENKRIFFDNSQLQRNEINQKDNFVLELYKEGFYIEEGFDELQKIRFEINNKRFSNDVLDVTIAPTLACNFKCPYCFEYKENNPSSKMMSDSVKDRVIDFVEKRSENIKLLNINWYGGEPLLGMKIIKELTEKFKKICKYKNIIYQATLTTNGYLLHKVTKKDLKKWNISSIQITLDGPKRIHDKLRYLYNNMPTFKQITENIIPIQDDFFIAIRVNLDKNNLEYIEELREELKSRGVSNYYLSVAKITNDDMDESCLNCKEFSSIWGEYHGKEYFKTVIEEPDNYHGLTNYCTADSENSFVIDNLGFVYKCWRDIGRPEKSIFDLSKNTNINMQLYYEYLSYDPTIDKQCKECKMLPRCVGGCPHDRIHNRERCSHLKHAVPDVIKKYLIEE